MDWFYASNGVQQGPVNWAALVAMASSGRLKPTDLVWQEGFPAWQQVGSIPNLKFANPTSDAELKWLIPVGRSGWAIAAGYFGLFSVIGLGAPLALIAGIVALRDIKRNPGLGGKGRAIFGVVMGAICSLLAAGQERHPILRGIAPGTIFGLSDVYGVRLPLLGDSQPLVLGEVTETLDPKSGAAAGSKNAPMMPVAWTRTYRGASGRSARVFTTTMGAAQDFAFEGTRRMLVNAVYWSLGMEKRIPAKSAIDFVGEFKPSPFKFRTLDEWKPGRTPADLQSPAGSSEPITPKAYPALDRTQGVPASGRKYQIRPAIAGIGTKYRSQQQGVGIPALVVPEVENPRHQKASVFQTRLVRRTTVLVRRGFSTSGQFRPPIAWSGTNR